MEVKRLPRLGGLVIWWEEVGKMNKRNHKIIEKQAGHLKKIFLAMFLQLLPIVEGSN